MRKKNLMIMLLLLPFVFSSCIGSNVATDPLDNETASSANSDEMTASQQFLFFDFSQLVSTGKRAKESELKKPTSLPDTKGTARGKTDDVAKDSAYYISALDITLEIPEGYFIYRVNGLYVDKDDTPVQLEFVDEYLITTRAFKEEELIREIYAYSDSRSAYPGPPWVIWGFSVFHKDYYPIEQLYSSRIEQGQEIRTAGDYYVSMGTHRLWTALFDKTYYAPVRYGEFSAVYNEWLDGDGKDIENLRGDLVEQLGWSALIPAEEFHLIEFIQEIIEATEGSGVHYTYLESGQMDGDEGEEVLLYNEGGALPGWKEIEYREDGTNPGWKQYPYATIVNDTWWEAYCYALKELNSDSNRYHLPDITLSLETYSGYFTQYQHLQGGNWKANDAGSVKLRAYAYAYLKADGREKPLEEISVYLNYALGGAPLFVVLTVDPDSNRLDSPIMKGIDYFSACDLDFSRQYAESLLRTAGLGN